MSTGVLIICLRSDGGTALHFGVIPLLMVDVRRIPAAVAPQTGLERWAFRRRCGRTGEPVTVADGRVTGLPTWLPAATPTTYAPSAFTGFRLVDGGDSSPPLPPHAALY